MQQRIESVAAARAERRTVIRADREEPARDERPRRAAPDHAHDQRLRTGRMRDHELADDGTGHELIEVAEQRALRELHRRPVRPPHEAEGEAAGEYRPSSEAKHEPREQRYDGVELPLDREAPVHDVDLRREHESHVLVDGDEQQDVPRIVEHRTRP